MNGKLEMEFFLYKKISHSGTTAEEQAAIDQWLEYRVAQVDKSLQEKDVSTVLRVSLC